MNRIKAIHSKPIPSSDLLSTIVTMYAGYGGLEAVFEVCSLA